MDLVSAGLPARTLGVAIDPGKVTNVLSADGERGLVGDVQPSGRRNRPRRRISARRPASRWPLRRIRSASRSTS